VDLVGCETIPEGGNFFRVLDILKYIYKIIIYRLIIYKRKDFKRLFIKRKISFKYTFKHFNKDKKGLNKFEGIHSLEVNTSILVMADRLHILIKAEASCSLDDWAINEQLVCSIIDLSEGIIVSAGNTEGWG
jgi:hypothetical protein